MLDKNILEWEKGKRGIKLLWLYNYKRGECKEIKESDRGMDTFV